MLEVEFSINNDQDLRLRGGIKGLIHPKIVNYKAL